MIKLVKLTKEEQATYRDCVGHCQVCFYDGGCSIQDKLNKRK